MGRRRKGAVPPYLLHKGTGQAYATYNGDPVYFGKHGTAASRRLYREFVGRWEACQVPQPLRVGGGVGSRVGGGFVSVREVTAAFLGHARIKYVLPSGAPTTQYAALKRVCDDLDEVWGDVAADTIAGAELRKLREKWKAKEVSPTTLNVKAGLVRLVFRWAADPERRLVPPAVVAELESLANLPAEPDREEVNEVPAEVIEATASGMAEPYASMVRIESLVGMRPAELCAMVREEVNTGGVARVSKNRTIQLPAGIWAFSPSWHKTIRKRRYLTYPVGPQAQAILGPFLAAANTPSSRLFLNSKGRPVIYRTYWRHIRDGCLVAGVDPPWSPNQLRHSTLTRYDSVFGLQRAGGIVGHTQGATTARYLDLERRLRQAAEDARQLG